MKALLLGDASNYHAALAQGLRTLGHEVTVASNGSRWLDTGRDIDISRRPDMLSGAILRLRLATTLASSLKGYDVVQLVSPGFVDLRPVHLRSLLKKLKRQNGAVYLTALGTDSALVRNLTGPSPALEYSEWQYGHGLTPWAHSPQAQMKQWLKPHLQRYTDFFYDNIDGAVTALYEYHRILEAEYPGLPLAYGGIPIVGQALPAPAVRPADPDVPVRIYYAVHPARAGEKGADILHDMLLRLKAEMPGRIELVEPGAMPYSAFVQALAGADMVCDQLYSYTPSTTPLLAMAMGLVPISGGEDDFYRFIGEDSLRPIFNPDPRDLEGTYSRLRSLVADPAALRAMSAAAPAFVAKHNDAMEVARRFLSFWGCLKG